MSDFLSQLTTRNRQTAPAIRPRLAGLFEPLQPAGSGLFPGTPAARHAMPGEFAREEEWFGPMPASAGTSAPVAAPVAAHGLSEPIPASATPPPALRLTQLPVSSANPVVPTSAAVPAGSPPMAVPPDQSLARPLTHRATDGGPVAPPAPVRAAAHSTAPAAPEPPRGAPPAAREHTPAAGLPSRTQPLAAPPGMADQRQHTIAPTPNAPDRTPALPARPAAPAGPVPAQPAPLTPSTQRIMLPPPRQAILAQPQVRPVTAPTPAPRPREPQREAEPTIQVTIGRVEVRAVPAETPVRPARPAPLSLSLEDYLRQRNGGRR